MLAAVDESLFQLAVLLLLGAGSLVKTFLERKRKREMEIPSEAGVEQGDGEGEPAKDPLQALLEAVDPQTRVSYRRREDTLKRLAGVEDAEEQAELEQEGFVEELPDETAFVEALAASAATSAAAPTPEASILGAGLTGAGKMDDIYGQGTTSTEPWDPGSRIRKSVFEDIERSVATDISEHVAADMGGGIRGEATAAPKAAHTLVRHARRGWRDAVVAAEALGAPLALRDPASLPGGLRN